MGQPFCLPAITFSGYLTFWGAVHYLLGTTLSKVSENRQTVHGMRLHMLPLCSNYRAGSSTGSTNGAGLVQLWLQKGHNKGGW